MKVFVTVGTTNFDSLIRSVDEQLNGLQYDVTMQISNGSYQPKNFSYFRFSSDIFDYFNDADIIITHAGAGSIYELLEFRKKIIIVPNLDRIDKHQSDIADYMHENGYALSLYDLNDISAAIKHVDSCSLNKFVRVGFFKAKEIADFICR